MTKAREFVRFGLAPGFRIGNYSLIRRLGSGLTAEAYLAHEVMTGAQRVVKIYANHNYRDQILRQRDFAHYAWVLERISRAGTRILPLYHHMGHAFLPPSETPEDGDNSSLIGNYYIVQEYIEGTSPKAATYRSLKRAYVVEFVNKVRATHAKAQIALGDINPENLIICAKSKEIRMVDCDYGLDNDPNDFFVGDFQDLIELFGPRVKPMLYGTKPAKPKRAKNPTLALTYTPSTKAAE